MPKYTKRAPQEVEAHELTQPVQIGDQQGKPGDYLVVLPGGTMKIVAAEEFEREYTRHWDYQIMPWYPAPQPLNPYRPWYWQGVTYTGTALPDTLVSLTNRTG